MVVAVVRGLGAGGDDEGVVGECVAVGEEDFFYAGINVYGLAEEDFGVFLAAENGADGGGDFGGGKRAGGDLIKEGLEEVEVALVEKGDVHVGAVESLRGDEARETSTEDEHAVWRGHGEEFLLIVGMRFRCLAWAVDTIISRT
jgi:hypothetical protein